MEPAKKNQQNAKGQRARLADNVSGIEPKPGEIDWGATSCYGFGFGNATMARGYNWLGTARGPIVMSNVFLSTGLIYLAAEEVGCLEPNVSSFSPELVVTEDCNARVFGIFRPASLITNIAVISGIMAAFFMPIAGALIDFTSHRWTTGVVSAILITLVQIVQIGTNAQTWFFMAMLQAVAGFLYQVQILATYSYLPNIAREVDHQTMKRFVSTFTIIQFASQAIFLAVVASTANALDLNDVGTAVIGQAINSANIIVSFFLGWRLLPSVPARRNLESSRSILWQGFVQNWTTAKRISQEYKRSLRWFLLGVMFGEPAANAYTTVSVVFLSHQLQLTAKEIGTFFFLVLMSMIPGGGIFHFICRRSNASVTLRLSMMVLFALAVAGALMLTPGNLNLLFMWGTCVGLALGGYYPSLKLYLSLVVPHGQEAELAGFFVYCTQILVWLPPLVFSCMVEADIDQRIGIIACASFFLIAVVFLSAGGPFDKILEEVHKPQDRQKILPLAAADTLSKGGP